MGKLSQLFIKKMFGVFYRFFQVPYVTVSPRFSRFWDDFNEENVYTKPVI